MARRAADEVAVLAAVGERLGRAARQALRATGRGVAHQAGRLATAAARGAQVGTRAAGDGTHRVTGSARRRSGVRWPWVLAGVAVTAGVAGALAQRRPVAPPPAPGPPRIQDVRADATDDGAAGPVRAPTS